MFISTSVGSGSVEIVPMFQMNSLIIIAFACWINAGSTNCNCEDLRDGKENYLFKICNYIKAKNIDVSPGDPCKYKIEYMRKDIFEKKRVIIIYLDCCYLGDKAYIDKATLEVIAFRLGVM